MAFRCFSRVWWQENPSWPDGLEPYPTAPKRALCVKDTSAEAREFCQEGNKTHKPGRYSRKAEFEECR